MPRCERRERSRTPAPAILRSASPESGPASVLPDSAPATQTKSRAKARAKARAKTAPHAARSPPDPRPLPDPRPTPAGNNLGVVKSIGGRAAHGVVCVHIALHRGETITYGTSSVGTPITPTELVDHERIVYVEQRNVGAENLGSAIIFGLSSGRRVPIEGVSREPIKNRMQIQADEGTQIYGLQFNHGELVDIRVTSCFRWT